MQDVKDVMPDLDIDTTYDYLIRALITRASRAIDGYLKREPNTFYSDTDTTRYFDGSGCREQWIGEYVSITSVSVSEAGGISSSDYTAWAATDYMTWPYNASQEGMPIMRLDVDQLNGTKAIWYKYPKSIKIVGKPGFSATPPEEIKQACIIQVIRWWKRGQQAYQDTGAIIELSKLHYTQRIDPDVAQLLDTPKFQRVTI
jgi:hypothetical protein